MPRLEGTEEAFVKGNSSQPAPCFRKTVLWGVGWTGGEEPETGDQGRG